MNYYDQHTGTTYSGPVLSLMMRYFCSVGCERMAYQQQSNVRKVSMNRLLFHLIPVHCQVNT